MRFLKVLLWLLLGGVIAGFVIYNGDQRVSIQLWAGMVADISLPLLLIVVFLAGFLPMLVAYQTLRWRMRQRFAGLERALADLRTIPAAPAPRLEPMTTDTPIQEPRA
jgi:pilus assembly protein TadC